MKSFHVLSLVGEQPKLSKADQPDEIIALDPFVVCTQQGLHLSAEEQEPSFHIIRDWPALTQFPLVAQKVCLFWWGELERHLQVNRQLLLCVVPMSLLPKTVSLWKEWLAPKARRPTAFVNRDFCAILRARNALLANPTNVVEYAVRREHPEFPWLRVAREVDGSFTILGALRDPGDRVQTEVEGTLHQDARALWEDCRLECQLRPERAVWSEGARSLLVSLPRLVGAGRQLLSVTPPREANLRVEARLSNHPEDVSFLNALACKVQKNHHTLVWDLHKAYGQISLFEGSVLRQPLGAVTFDMPGLLA